MRIDTFKKPPHSDITSTCKIFTLLAAANFCIILLGSFRFHMRIHLYVLPKKSELFLG